MPQTLQAFLAMLIVSLISINQQRSVLSSYDVMIGQAIEVMCSGVALQAMEFVTSAAFDDAVVGEGYVTSPSQLEDPPFSGGNACTFRETGNGCDDLDDFNDMVPDILTFETRDGGLQRFAISAEVYYVDQSLNPDSMVTYETYAKMVRINVTDADGLMNNVASITRLVVCDPSMGCN